MDQAYASVMNDHIFEMDATAKDFERHGFDKDKYPTMLAIQKQTIALAKKQQNDETEAEEPNDSAQPPFSRMR